jgi:hypothetical protein
MTDGFNNPYSDTQQQVAHAYLKYDRREAYREGDCFLGLEQKYSAFKDDCFSPTNNGTSIMIWGDSHAAALSYGLRKNFLNVTQLTASGCVPITGVDPINSSHCVDINNYVMEKINEFRPDILIIHANWFAPKNIIESGLKDALSHTALDIRSRSPKTRIIIIGGVPQWRPSLPVLLLKINIELMEEAYVYSQDYYNIQSIDRILLDVANASNTTFISVIEIVCNKNRCLSSVKDDGVYEPFAWDYGHLTKASSSLLAKEILSRIHDINPAE